MLWKTHVAGGLLAGALVLPYCAAGDISSQALFIGCAGVSALLNDIDSPQSKFGRLLWPVSKMLQLTAGHRGVLHSLVASVLLYSFLQALLPAYATPITIGYLSHILLDLFNPAGVPLLWPIQQHFSIPIVQTGSFVEKILFIPLAACCVFLVFTALVGPGIPLLLKLAA